MSKEGRIPPVFYCDMCEYHVKVKGLRNGTPGRIPQFVVKRCSTCTEAEGSAKTGSDRDPLP